ncbi:hypothetical protein N9247_00180 [bacterium]|nr:hypothetical protein [bacterium]
MSRPATLKVGNTSYWTIMTYTSAGVLVDADSTPTVVVYKNGTLTADVVTITKRSATTGIYDAYYNPASEAEGDCFTIQETATISSQAYVQSWNFEILAAERGTDNASTFDAASDTVTTDSASRTASQANVSALATSASIAALNDFDPASDTVSNVTTVAVVTNAVVTDSASRTASQADVSALATSSEISSLNNITVQQIWDSLTSGSYISGSFGERLLVSQGTHRTVQVTGSNHVAADVHEVQADGLTNSTEIAGIWSTLVADGAVYQFTTNALENAPSGSVSIPAIVDAVWDEQRTGHTTPNTFGYFLDAQVSGAGSGGSGLYQVTVRIEDSSNNALQGARVNVDGTTLTLTTGSSGEIVFNLDSGVYLLNVSPPAGYTTPLGQVVTVTTADLSETFTLVGSGTCSPGWLG